jgi:hypothetical protein
MKYVLASLGLIGILATTLIVGCVPAKIGDFQEQMGGFIAKVDSVFIKVSELEEKVSEMEATLSVLQENHPELFEEVTVEVEYKTVVKKAKAKTPRPTAQPATKKKSRRIIK